MKQEISAGGVIVRKNKSQWEVLLLKDMNGNWTFPKGLVEKGEDAVSAAVREIAEEVGITDVSVVSPLTPIHYMYQRNGLISKTVAYFVFTSKGQETPKGQKEEGISDVRWVPFDEAIDIIGYTKTNKPLLIEAKTIFSKGQSLKTT